MFRLNTKRKILNFVNVTKASKHKLPNEPLTPYKQIMQRYQYVYEASLFPWLFGLTTLGFTTFGITYHYNDSVRNIMKSYLPENVFHKMQDILGPNNGAIIRKKFNEVSVLSSIPWFSTSTEKDSIENRSITEEAKQIPTHERSMKKMLTSGKEEALPVAAKEVDKSEQANIEFSAKATKLLDELESLSKETMGHLLLFESKIKEHSQKMKIAIEDDGTSKTSPWEEVNAVSHQQQTSKLKADNEMRKLEAIIKKMDTLVNDSRRTDVLSSNPSVKIMQEKISNTRYNISKLQADIEKAQFNAQITNQYKELIQQGRERFKEELSSLSPNVSSWTKKRTDKLSNEDLNALIIHAHRRIYQLQARIAELESMDAIRLETALSEQRKVDEQATKDAVERELERASSKMLIEKQAEIDSLKQKNDQNLRQALTRQATAHSEHLTQLLRIQREEVDKQHDLTIREVLLKERERMRAAIEGWRMRVEGLEAAVEGRADQERLSREAQDLWVACHALQGILSGPGPTPPLARYISSFEEAAQPSSLPIVRLFLSSVPGTALTDGVCTQDVLSKRFEKMKRVCKRVAMIEETSGSMAMYAVSWIRSLFIMTQSCLIERETIIDPCTERIDTHQILASAELAMWRQDVDLAIRLLNLLVGMPRAVAHDWITDARVYLETKLAAEALGSYTSSKTAGSISFEPDTVGTDGAVAAAAATAGETVIVNGGGPENGGEVPL